MANNRILTPIATPIKSYDTKTKVNLLIIREILQKYHIDITYHSMSPGFDI